jgi:hypothetical protein
MDLTKYIGRFRLFLLSITFPHLSSGVLGVQPNSIGKVMIRPSEPENYGWTLVSVVLDEFCTQPLPIPRGARCAVK